MRHSPVPAAVVASWAPEQRARPRGLRAGPRRPACVVLARGRPALSTAPALNARLSRPPGKPMPRNAPNTRPARPRALLTDNPPGLPTAGRSAPPALRTATAAGAGWAHIHIETTEQRRAGRARASPGPARSGGRCPSALHPAPPFPRCAPATGSSLARRFGLGRDSAPGAAIIAFFAPAAAAPAGASGPTCAGSFRAGGLRSHGPRRRASPPSISV